MGTNYYMVRTRPTLNAPLHIGKHSYGWKFLFHYVAFDYEHEIKLHNYWDWFIFIYTKVHEGSYVILDECEQEVTPDELFSIIQKAQHNNNKDDFTYCMNIDGYRFTEGEFC